MKKLVLAAAITAIASSVLAADYSVKPKVTSLKAQPQTVLIVGNSYTYYNCGLFDYLWGFSGASKTKKLETQMSATAAAGLDWQDVKGLVQPTGNSWSFLLKKHDGRLFDAVILQGNSLEPIDPRMKDSFRKYAALHSKTIREADGEPLLMITWARDGKPEMTQQLADATIKVANENNAMAVPVGLAFAEVQRRHPEIKLIMPDHSHPTAAGSYLAGAVIWSTLLKESLEGNTFPGGCEKPLPPDVTLKLQKGRMGCHESFLRLVVQRSGVDRKPNSEASLC